MLSASLDTRSRERRNCCRRGEGIQDQGLVFGGGANEGTWASSLQHPLVNAVKRNDTSEGTADATDDGAFKERKKRREVGMSCRTSE